MATDEAQPPEGFDTVDAPTTDTEDDAVTLSPGEALHGVVLSVDEEKSGYGNHLYTLKDNDRGTVDWFGNSQIDRRYNAGAFEPGDTVWICKTSEEESFENEDGEEISYNLFKLAVQEVDD